MSEAVPLAAPETAPETEPEPGLVQYETFEYQRHRAELERWVVAGGVVAAIVLIVGAFVVLMWGPVSAKSALAPVMTALGGVILGMLACVLHPFKARRGGEGT